MTERLGLAAIQWDVISGDATPGTTAPQIVRGVLAGVKPGSIVVFHANGRSHGTAEALPDIVRALRAKGYRFVTVSELLRFGDPVTTDDCYELRPGDNRRYDRLFGEGTG
jgi:peptidoglycan-N-acetylglucosamine deacetylase